MYTVQQLREFGLQPLSAIYVHNGYYMHVKWGEISLKTSDNIHFTRD